MKASLRSVRIAPKKANLVAKMVRGMRAADAMEALRRTNKKAARLIEEMLRSAMANASHNAKQDPQTMVIREIVVNQAQSYRRGIPMARGRQRPIRKFMSHISIALGFADEEKSAINKKKKTMTKKTRVSSASSSSSSPSSSSLPWVKK